MEKQNSLRRHRSGAEYPTSGQLTASSSAITPYRPLSSRFKLPPDWGIEQVLRSSGDRVDRYYYEPGTGQKFRSLRDVERRLNGEIFAPRNRASGVRNYPKSSLSRKMVICDGKIVRMDEEQLNEWAIVPSTRAATLPYDLPDGWVIEEVPRTDGSSMVDKYYYEPGSGQKFRSRIAAQRYLAQMRENVPLSATLEELKENKPLSKMFKLYHHAKKSLPCKRNIVTENSSFLSPPAKVNWVLSSPKGDAWNPLISGTPIPDSLKQQWTKRFKLFMNDENLNAEKSD